MKRTLAILVLTAMTGLASAQTYVTNTVPGGTFDPVDYGYWTNNGAVGVTFDYPVSGGNPDGYAQINATSGGWGVFVGGISNGTVNALQIPLSTFSLTPNVPCTVLMDMKIEAGANIGGLKMESYDGSDALISDSGEVYLSATTTNWATYAFPYTPAIGATGIKFVPLWGPNSTVGYDNVRVIATTSLPINANITYPINGATIWTNFTILANSTVLGANVTNVAFYSGATLLGSDDTSPYKWNVTGQVPAGPAQLTVVAKDDGGGVVTSAVVNVTIQSQVETNVVSVNSTNNWAGRMAVFDQQPNDFNFVFASAWGVADLSAAFSGTGSASVLTLKPAPINNTDGFWYDYTDPSYPTGMVGAVGFKTMEAAMYVGLPNSAGKLVKFSGTNVSNTLDVRFSPGSTNLIGNGWTNYAFIRNVSPDFTPVSMVTVPLTNGAAFELSFQTDTDPTLLVQYGFITYGPNVWPTDVDNYGSVVIQAVDNTSTTNVAVNPSASWLGFMNVFNQAGTGYIFGSAWGTVDLVAVFSGGNLVLSPNTIGDPSTDWYVGGGGPGAVGNRTMDASMYVESTGPLAGKRVVFSGTVLSNTLVSASNTNAAGRGWTSVAFIKDFAPNYSSSTTIAVPLTNAGPFSIELTTLNDPARHVQYGFQTVGPNVWVTDVAPFGNIVIGTTAVTPTSITPSISGGNMNLSFPSQAGKVYTVQYKDLLNAPAWSTLTTTNGTGATIVITNPANGGQRYYRLSIQ